MNRRRRLIPSLALAVLTPLAASGEVVLIQGVLGNGGGAASDGNHSILATSGQLATGLASVPDQICRQGFWYHTSHFCSGVTPSEPGAARVLWLGPAQPNPSRSSTAFRFATPKRSRVVMKVYDVTGREAATLIDAELEAGAHTTSLDAGRLPGGVYFCRLAAGRSTRTARLVLLR